MGFSIAICFAKHTICSGKGATMYFNESCHKKDNLPHLPSLIAKDLYYYVQWTGHFICKEDFHIQRRGWQSYLLLYTVSGEGRLIYEGAQYDLPKKSIAFIDCKKIHEYYPTKHNWEFKYIHFEGSEAAKLHTYITEECGGAVLYDVKDLERCFDIVYEYVKASEGEERCSDVIYGILMGLIHHHNKSEDEDKIKRSLYYISKNYSDDIAVDELAAAVHLTRCYFSTLFKNHTGMSPAEYILRYRLRIAKQMLCDTDCSVETIGDKCGFRCATTFIRAFKRHERTTPSQYRRKNRFS